MIETIKPTIAITATFTVELVEEPLAYWMQELGIQSGIEFAPYNQVFQQLLDPLSLFSKNDKGVNVVLIRLEDWQRYKDSSTANVDSSSGEYEKIEHNVQDLIQALKSAAKRSGTPCIVCFCPASFAVKENPDRSAFFVQMEELMASELNDTGGVYLVTTSELSTTYPVSQYNDPFTDGIGHIPYTPAFFTSLSTMIARRIFALRSKPYKVIVLDCDQTLWKGICGENGSDGVEIDAPHQALQEFMIAQRDAGMLLCLCSKNNEEDVVQVFDRHSRMLLRRDHIVAWRINWKNKSENIKSLADELQLGLDSFIFIDDNPIECAQVQAECPEVLTLQLPQEQNDIPRFFDHVWAFDHLKVTEEDKERTKLYKQNIKRSQFQKETLTFHNFLAGLELKVNFSEMSDSQIARVAQLTQRTNQFNFATVRRSEADIQKLCQSEELECLVVGVSDRFGDYGLVGVIMFRTNGKALEVDTFLLSCRVLGRGVEHQMLAKLGEIAQERSLNRINIPCIPTRKNQPALDFLHGIAGKLKKQYDNHLIFTLPVEYAVSLSYDSTISKVYAQKARKKEIPDTYMGGTPRSTSRLLERIATELYDVERIIKDIESKKQYSEPSRIEKGYVAPRTPTEETLAEIWSQVLSINQISIYDNFFELGGHSLSATQIMSRVRDTFGVELSFRSFFDAPTIVDTAVIITDNESWNMQMNNIEVTKLLKELSQLSEDQAKIMLNEETLSQSDIHPSLVGNDKATQPVHRAICSEETANTITSEYYRCADIERFTVGDNLELVYSRSNCATRILPSEIIDLLYHCQSFQTLEDHARNICHEPEILQREVEAIMNQLSEFADTGFLISQKSLLDHCARSVEFQEAPAEIASVALLTYNQIDTLKRGLVSYIKNSKQFARTNDFVVMVDSENRDIRNSYQQMLHSMKSNSGVEIYYAGLEEKVRFANKLIKGGDLPPEVVNFSLFDMENIGFSNGANRNAVLLHTVSDTIFSTDDDTVCRIAAPPSSEEGLAFTSGCDPAQCWFFPDRQTTLQSVNFVEEDVLAFHERFLGKSLGSIVSALKGMAKLTFNQIDSEFLRRLGNGSGKVQVTFNGVIGDCAWGAPFGLWGDPIGYLLLGEKSHARLVKSESEYHSACISRELFRIVSCPTISDETFSQTTFVGLDNQHLLPPFFPVRRGMDKIFGITLWKCFDEAYFCHLPQALLHAPAKDRRFWPGEITRSASGFDIDKVIIECIKSLEFGPGKKDGKERLRALGKHLMELGSILLADFEEFVKTQAWKTNSQFISLMEEHLCLHGESPDYWSNDIKKYISILCQSMVRKDYWVPLDLLEGRTIDEVRELTQRLVFNYGQLLYWWPEIVEVSKNLRTQGQRLAKPV